MKQSILTGIFLNLFFLGTSYIVEAQEITPPAGMAQVTAVSALTDVLPTDWAFTSLQSLIERYGCIAGYPNQTYGGVRALSRFEFAAGLNACLDRVNELLASGLGDKVNKADLTTLQQLQEEFSRELVLVKGKVDALDAKVATLENQQFSTISKLGGEVVFGLAGATGAPRGSDDPNVIFPYVARLGVVTSFTGSDRLRIGLQSANFGGSLGQSSALGFGDNLRTLMTLLSYQSTTDNQFALENLEYRFPAFNDRVVFTLRPVGFSLGSVLTSNSPYFDTGRGAISRFAEASPLFKIGNLNAGGGLDWLLSNQVRLQVAYGTREASDPAAGGGITGANNSALGIQVLTKPADTLWAGIGYINAYSSTGELGTLTGSFAADNGGRLNQPAQTNALSGTLNWAISPTIRFGAWGGWTFTNATNSAAYANTTTYLFSLGLSDPFGRDGDLVAFLFGQPPKLTEGKTAAGIDTTDQATGLHYELFYRYRVNRNISITPGFFVVTNPDHASGRDAVWVGTIRTVFRF